MDSQKRKGPQSKYSSAFTAAALLYKELNTIINASGIDTLNQTLRNEVKQNAFLAIKTESARKRVVQELLKRIDSAPKEMWGRYSNWTDQEKRLGLFYLCLKTYPLLFDFHFEVSVKKWRMHTNALDHYDIRLRLEEISSVDPFVFGWSDKTKEKVISRYFGMLSEAGLFVKNKLVVPVEISDGFRGFFVKHDPWFITACFLQI